MSYCAATQHGITSRDDLPSHHLADIDKTKYTVKEDSMKS